MLNKGRKPKQLNKFGNMQHLVSFSFSRQRPLECEFTEAGDRVFILAPGAGVDSQEKPRKGFWKEGPQGRREQKARVKRKSPGRCWALDSVACLVLSQECCV